MAAAGAGRLCPRLCESWAGPRVSHQGYRARVLCTPAALGAGLLSACTAGLWLGRWQAGTSVAAIPGCDGLEICIAMNSAGDINVGLPGLLISDPEPNPDRVGASDGGELAAPV